MTTGKNDKNERVWKLYKYTCIPNGLIYFGITSKTLKERWRYGNGYKFNPYLHSAIKKYGDDGFIREIVLDNLTLEEAERKEIEYIEKYNTTDPNIGFNISGGGASGMYGRTMSQETRDRISKKLKNRPTGKKGVKLSPEHREIASNNLRKKAIEKRMPVNQYSLDGKYIKTWKSITDAINEYDSGVCSCCKGTRNICKGYMWKYSNGDTKNIEPYYPTTKRRVAKLDKDTDEIIEIFESIKKQVNLLTEVGLLSPSVVVQNIRAKYIKDLLGSI